MPGKAAKITITERQQDILQTFSRSVTAASRLRQRAAIIVLAFDGLLNEDISRKVGLTPPSRTLATALGRRVGSTGCHRVL